MWMSILCLSILSQFMAYRQSISTLLKSRTYTTSSKVLWYIVSYPYPVEIMNCNYNIIYRANSFLCNSRKKWLAEKRKEKKEEKLDRELSTRRVQFGREVGPAYMSTPKEEEDDDGTIDYPTSDDTKTSSESEKDLNSSYAALFKDSLNPAAGELRYTLKNTWFLRGSRYTEF